MKHPLRCKNQKELRDNIWDFIKTGFNVHTKSNLIFVCGGNEKTHMRRKFQNKFSSLLSKFIYFEPEFAMRVIFDNIENEPFDLTDFESLIADLSYAIVIFPEAAGSYAELGYFSQNTDISQKTIIVLNACHQGDNSFIELGPVRKINNISSYGFSIQISYEDPDFSLISKKILSRGPKNDRLVHFEIDKFNMMSKFHLFCLVFLIVYIHGIATLEQIVAFFRSHFKQRTKPNLITRIVAILIGANMLGYVSEYKFLTCKVPLDNFLKIKDTKLRDFRFLNTIIGSIIVEADSEFIKVYNEYAYVD